jgi:TrmH family RNA methyltransferase
MNGTETITSRDNAKLKLARAVRDGRETSLIFVEGTRLFEEAVRSGIAIEQILISSDVSDSTKLADGPVSARSAVVKVAPRLFDSIADTKNSQGIVALAQKPKFWLEEIPEGIVVLLSGANNPANIGAVVRTAEAAGAAGLITTTGSADAYSSKALRASMGSAFRLPIIERMSFADAVRWAREQGMRTTATDISGTVIYTNIDWTVPRLLVFGSEAHGLEEPELASIDEKILIPMENEVESLNLAVSSGIVLFEAKRQRTG